MYVYVDKLKRKKKKINEKNKKQSKEKMKKRLKLNKTMNRFKVYNEKKKKEGVTFQICVSEGTFLKKECTINGGID